jgi:hypothetical protein
MSLELSPRCSHLLHFLSISGDLGFAETLRLICKGESRVVTMNVDTDAKSCKSFTWMISFAQVMVGGASLVETGVGRNTKSHEMLLKSDPVVDFSEVVLPVKVNINECQCSL